MAHPCIYCDSECYCSGDIDDIIVSKTPKRCEGCGCEEFAEDQGWNEDDDFDDYDQLDEEDPQKKLINDQTKAKP
jgi:hypothetical protein